VAAENSRIAELRRRIEADPASIAFAQLAEEYRREGEYAEAVKYCRLGLVRHPDYLSARITLGRALLQLDALDDAAREFEFVLAKAPDNLGAIRGLAEIHERRGSAGTALEYYKRALALARFDPKLEATVDRMDRVLGRAASRDETVARRTEVFSRPTPSAKGRDATADRARDTVVDFDHLLAALGTPGASPPPATERLFSDDPSSAGTADPIVPDLSSSAPQDDDVFARLEAELRAFDRATQASAESAILDELEGWLRAVVAARASSGTT
jgi:tetratricopeptide (TPR) repeat protein